MREIKFRVWDKNRRGFLYHSRNTIDSQNLWLSLEGALTSVTRPNHEIENFIIQQFTGLKDVNGVDIYEGDIILETWEENQPYGYDPYEWYNQTSKFVVEYKAPSFNFPKRYGDQRSIENYELKVIGNIFEDKNDIR